MMGDEFHAVLKLVTGEEIFALVSVDENDGDPIICLLYTSPSPRDRTRSRMPSSA